ncbi:glycosyltransferase family 2 protein [Anabaena sp. UHCC 0204]|uniref:glycosyltransferase family 2 protein n=1 Tax=Anabaena sp. UHCC 0204 TaxID=2590009 RepID=UPI0014470625|nr:glycosyltransferase family 2 protein [Anabaena sp. UHCC 0204]MTJ08765.1 glycosyltransferase family 2 protein [Anabaena sp. UHCC 0204]
MNPEVSVIIPAYNTEKYIAKAIESVLQQTLNNLELIVVDDSSSDDTVAIASSFADPRVKVLVNSENLGAAATRNRAISEATGKWIAVLDSDDWYAPERLEKLVQIASTEKADMIADDLYLIRQCENAPWSTLITESRESICTTKQIDPVYFVETDVYGKRGLHLGISKPMFRQDFLIQNQIQYDPSVRMGQDFWLSLTGLVRGARFFLVPEPYYFYLSRSGSLVYGSKVERLIQSCHKFVDFVEKEEIATKQPRLYNALCRNYTAFKRYLSYYSVVEPLKEKKWLNALKEMLKNPYFFIHFFIQLPLILNRRIQFFWKNESGNEVT